MSGRAIDITPPQRSTKKAESQKTRTRSTSPRAKLSSEVVDDAPNNAGDFLQPVKKPLGISFYSRYVPEKSDHGKLYFNLSYQLTKDLRVGADVRPLTGDVSLLANWRVLSETKTRPALILGTSHDEFNDIPSQSYYGTLSKHLFSHNEFNFSGYAGATYIEKLDEIRAVGGTVISKGDWSTTLMYSGEDIHWVLSKKLPKNQTLSLFFFALDLPGVAYGVRF